MKTSRIVLVHGNDLCGDFYKPLAQQLEQRGFSTTLLDLPDVPTWSALVDFVVEAGESHMFLVGHSMGGLLALLAAARRPAWLRGLVLLEPAIFPGKLFASIAVRRYVPAATAPGFHNWNGGMRRIHDVDRFPRDKIELYLRTRASRDPAVVRALFSSLPELYPLPYADVNVPTLLVTGAHTGFVGRMMARSIRRHLDVTSVEIQSAAHWMANEQDALVADAITAHLSGAPAARTSAPGARARA